VVLRAVFVGDGHKEFCLVFSSKIQIRHFFSESGIRLVLMGYCSRLYFNKEVVTLFRTTVRKTTQNTLKCFVTVALSNYSRGPRRRFNECGTTNKTRTKSHYFFPKREG